MPSKYLSLFSYKSFAVHWNLSAAAVPSVLFSFTPRMGFMEMVLCSSLVVLLCFAVPVTSHEGPHEKMTMEEVKEKFENFRQGKVGNEDEHIREHLESVASIPQEEMTPQQKHLYYFYLHDTDKDNRIDGLEIVHAIFHNTGSLESFDAESVIPMINNIMTERDKNDDGYLDYYEYRLLQTPSR